MSYLFANFHLIRRIFHSEVSVAAHPLTHLTGWSIMSMTMTMTMMMTMIRKAVDGERSSRMSKFSSLTLFVVAATFITLESTAALFDHQGIQLMFIFHQLWEKKLRSILGRKHQSLNCSIIFNSSLPEANLANKNFKDFCLIIKSWQPSFLIDKKKRCQPPSS